MEIYKTIENDQREIEEKNYIETFREKYFRLESQEARDLPRNMRSLSWIPGHLLVQVYVY